MRERIESNDSTVTTSKLRSAARPQMGRVLVSFAAKRLAGVAASGFRLVERSYLLYGSLNAVPVWPGCGLARGRLPLLPMRASPAAFLGGIYAETSVTVG